MRNWESHVVQTWFLFTRIVSQIVSVRFVRFCNDFISKCWANFTQVCKLSIEQKIHRFMCGMYIVPTTLRYIIYIWRSLGFQRCLLKNNIIIAAFINIVAILMVMYLHPSISFVITFFFLFLFFSFSFFFLIYLCCSQRGVITMYLT